MTWEAMIEAARRQGYSGPDSPVTDIQEMALAAALWKAADARRVPVEWHGIPVGSQEMIELVLSGRIEIQRA